MKEQLVTFETAKLAKEKGFKWGSSKGYCEDKTLTISQYASQCYNDNEDYPTKYAAPTQSLLQKWLREVYNIEVRSDVNFYYKKEKLGYFYSIDCFDENNIHDGKDYDLDQLKKVGKTKGFDTYEEALEKGLQEALNLIKE